MCILIAVLLSILKLQQKLYRSTKNWRTIRDPVPNPSKIQRTIHHNRYIDGEHNSKNFLNPYSLCHMDSATFKTLNHNIERVRGTLSPISILKQQFTNLEQTYICCFLHCDHWTVKKGVARQVCILSKEILNTRTSEQNSCYG